ncbi:MAG: hypothetical protein WAT79_10475 [Saprospiraceae bacterium]
MLSSFSKVVSVVQWKWNQEFIAQNLCINKEKPILKCKGKCHLMKMMEDTEPNEDSQSPPQKLGFDIYPFDLLSYSLNLHKVNLLSQEKNLISYIDHKYSANYSIKLVKPPESMV